MTIYTNGRNTVEGIDFELIKSLPQKPLPLHQQLSSTMLRNLVKEHPNTSLKRLCEYVKLDSGITLSTTAMCRLLLKLNLSYKVRWQPKAKSSSERKRLAA